MQHTLIGVACNYFNINRFNFLSSANLLLCFYLSRNSQARSNYKGLPLPGYMSLEYPAVQSNLLSERVSWNANGIILGIGTLEVSLTSRNHLSNV